MPESNANLEAKACLQEVSETVGVEKDPINDEVKS